MQLNPEHKKQVFKSLEEIGTTEDTLIEIRKHYITIESLDSKQPILAGLLVHFLTAVEECHSNNQMFEAASNCKNVNDILQTSREVERLFHTEFRSLINILKAESDKFLGLSNDALKGNEFFKRAEIMFKSLFPDEYWNWLY